MAREFIWFVCQFGAPDSLHTDQGQNFDSIKDVCGLLGIDKTRTTAYHLQSDGLVERLNQTILGMLSSVLEEDFRDCDLRLPLIMLAYRTSVQETTGASSFSLMFGTEACLPLDVMFGLCTYGANSSLIFCTWSLSIKNSITKAWKCLDIKTFNCHVTTVLKELNSRRVLGSHWGDNLINMVSWGWETELAIVT